MALLGHRVLTLTLCAMKTTNIMTTLTPHTILTPTKRMATIQTPSVPARTCCPLPPLRTLRAPNLQSEAPRPGWVTTGLYSDLEPTQTLRPEADSLLRGNPCSKLVITVGPREDLVPQSGAGHMRAVHREMSLGVLATEYTAQTVMTLPEQSGERGKLRTVCDTPLLHVPSLTPSQLPSDSHANIGYFRAGK